MLGPYLTFKHGPQVKLDIHREFQNTLNNKTHHAKAQGKEQYSHAKLPSLAAFTQVINDEHHKPDNDGKAHHEGYFFKLFEIHNRHP